MNDYLTYYGFAFSVFLLTFGAQLFVRNTYSKYSNYPSSSNITGAQVARGILDNNGLYDIDVVKTNGFLTDHYDPKNKRVVLSGNNYDSSSVSAVAIAAHECGHALQHKESYAFLNLRTAMLPMVNISSYAGYFAIMLGLFLNMINLVWIGIGLEAVILLFQVVTLPVEFDASSRAIRMIDEYGVVNNEEKSSAKKVLNAAAMTYVAGVATTLFQMLRLIVSIGGTSSRDRR